jgi:hypothetical protein
VYSSVEIGVSFVTGAQINLAVTNVLTEALPCECTFPEAVVTDTRLVKHCPAMDHPDFQASCHNII